MSRDRWMVRQIYKIGPFLTSDYIENRKKTYYLTVLDNSYVSAAQDCLLRKQLKNEER